MNNGVYPSIEELIPQILTHRLPASLQDSLKTRYEELGGKYLTKEEYIDGRLTNACMFNNSLQDAVEEVVDAVFNNLVWMYKHERRNGKVPTVAMETLSGLIEIYSLMKIQKEIDPIAGSI